jgi:hypothetical protein
MSEDEIKKLEELLETKTWYEILGYELKYYDYNDFQKMIQTNKKLIRYCDIWKNLSIDRLNSFSDIDNMIPPNPLEYYRLSISV